jgi:nuclear transport factor 2 (NTF2) superfamily protein
VTSKIIPPFTPDAALPEVKTAEQASNTRDLEIVANVYSKDLNVTIGLASSWPESDQGFLK